MGASPVRLLLSAQRRDVDDDLIEGEPEKRIHLIVINAADSADPQSKPDRRQVHPLADMSGVEMKVPVDPVSISLQPFFQVRRMIHQRGRVPRQLLAEAETPSLLPEIAGMEQPEFPLQRGIVVGPFRHTEDLLFFVFRLVLCWFVFWLWGGGL